MHWFEVVFIVLCWGVQIGIAAAIALVLGVVIRGIEQLIRRKKVRLLPRAAVMLLLVCAVLAALAVDPPVTCPEQYEAQFTEEQHQAVQVISRGIYSAKVPLVPAWSEVTAIRNDVIDGRAEYGVEFTIHYLWFGTVEMNYSSCDGYSITKPLN